jgi:hypothetical protein
MRDAGGFDGIPGSNGLFLADLRLTEAGLIHAEIEPAPPLQTVRGHEREMASLIYAIAAALEERCQAMGADWGIAPDAFGGRLDVEVPEGDDRERAAEIVAGVLSDLGLV